MLEKLKPRIESLERRLHQLNLLQVIQLRDKLLSGKYLMLILHKVLMLLVKRRKQQKEHKLIINNSKGVLK